MKRHQEKAFEFTPIQKTANGFITAPTIFITKDEAPKWEIAKKIAIQRTRLSRFKSWKLV